MNLILILCYLLFIVSCTHQQQDKPDLVSIQIIDRNGFAETMSTKDRLVRYQHVSFSDPQPYQKVLRVFAKNAEGKSPSTMTSYHDNGYIKQSLEILDGRAHGLYREWHANGMLKMELYVIEGIADLSEDACRSWIFEGTNRIFNEQGSCIAEIHYDKGLLQGTSTYFDADGHLLKEIPYECDKLHGTQRTFNSQGTLIASLSYIQELREGESFLCAEDGTLLAQEQFVQDLLQEGRYYTMKGELIAAIHDGYGQRAEFENEQLVRKVSYEQGLPEGLVECYTPDGFLHIVFSQHEGKKHGEEIEYYPKEPLQQKLLVTWSHDTLQGPVKTWFSDGTQESQKELYQNKKNGLSLAWYRNGDLMLQEEYENDQLLSGSYYKKGDKKPISRIIQGKGTASLYDSEGYFLRKIPYEKGYPILEGSP